MRETLRAGGYLEPRPILAVNPAKGPFVLGRLLLKEAQQSADTMT